MSDDTWRQIVIALITQTAPVLLGIAAVLMALRKQATTMDEVKRGVNGHTALLVKASTAAVAAVSLADGEAIGRAAATREGEDKAAALAAGRAEGMEQTLRRPVPTPPEPKS